MIEHKNNQLILRHDNAQWTARHDGEKANAGPVSLQFLNGPEVVRDCTFYIDDFTPECAILKNSKAFHRSGAAVVENQGYFPFGGNLKFKQTCRYAQNNLRVAFDLHWPRKFEIKRHLGIGHLTLPGNWTRMLIYPPAEHVAKGMVPAWRKLPPCPIGSQEIMVAHWHRPPLAVVFEKDDGSRLEIGTGNDVWRWNASLGYGPEAGSYKIFLNETGIRFVREPLMCCAPFTPRSQLYRFKWYAAWQLPKQTFAEKPPDNCRLLKFSPDGKIIPEKEVEKAAAYRLDFNKFNWPPSTCHSASQLAFIRDEHEKTPCWQSNATKNFARGIIRQIKERLPAKHLFIQGITPSPCWNSSHLDRNAADGLPHWDMSDILDFSVWTRRQFPEECPITFIKPSSLPDLPSLSGLFQANGFSTDKENL